MEVVSLRLLAAECRDTEACDFQILTRFTQPHRLCSRLSTEIGQNLDSISAATLGTRAQVNCTKVRHILVEKLHHTGCPSVRHLSCFNHFPTKYLIKMI